MKKYISLSCLVANALVADEPNAGLLLAANSCMECPQPSCCVPVCADACTNYDGCMAQENTFDIFGDFLYWKATEDQLEYAAKVTNTSVFFSGRQRRIFPLTLP